MEITRPQDRTFAKVLIFAPAGAGKTTLIGTAHEDERTSPMLLLDFEGGVGSLAGLDVPVARIRTWEDYNEVYENLAEGNVVDGFDYGEVRSVGIDSISETHTWALLTILDKEGPSRRDAELLEQRDYGKATVQMRRLLRAFRDLDLHVFYSAHAKEIEEPRTGKVKVPALAGQMAEEAAGLMDVVGYLATFEEQNEETEEMEEHRTLLLQGNPKFRTKARTPWGIPAPEEIEDPTVTSILDTLGFSTNGTPQRPAKEEVEPEEEEEYDGHLDGTSFPDNGTLREMKAWGVENGIDMTDVRTKGQARQAVIDHKEPHHDDPHQ